MFKRLTVTLKNGRTISGVYHEEGARLRQMFAETQLDCVDSKIEDTDENP